MEDNIIDLEARRKARKEPLQSSQAKLLAKLKKKHEPKRIQPERLIWAREMYGLSIEDWADILEVTPETVQEWEEGKSVPNEHQLHEYCADMFNPGWFYEPINEGWPGMEQTSLRFH